MIPLRQIETYAEGVSRQFRPLKIVLFGSCAYGNLTEDSDVDLMMVMPNSPSGVRNRDKANAIDSESPAAFLLNLLVKNPEDIAWQQEEDFLSANRLAWRASAVCGLSLEARKSPDPHFGLIERKHALSRPYP